MRLSIEDNRLVRAGGGTQGLLRALVAPTLTLVVIIACWDRFADVDVTRTRQALADMQIGHWLAATGLCALSYWCLGRYDALSHRLLKTGVSPQRGGRAGMAALAVSQTLGLGIFTGALARWRLLPDLGARNALALSTFVALSFMGAWAWLAMGLTTFMPLPGGPTTFLPIWSGAAFAFASAAVIALAVWPSGWPRKVRMLLRRRHIGLRALSMLGVYAIIDILAAAGVLAVFTEHTLGLTFVHLVPVFVIALGAGLLSGSPSGLGAFELTMLTLLPHQDPAVLIAAIAGYRLVYFALPATLGLGALLWPACLGTRWRSPSTRWEQFEPLGALPQDLEHALTRAPLAEIHLARQPGMNLMWSKTDDCGGVIGAAGHSLVMVRDPMPVHQVPAILEALSDLATVRGLTPCLYKCSARTAAIARQRGYDVLRVAHEAWLSPQDYDLAARSRRQLRRKLRHAEKAGLTFECADQDRLPREAMRQVNDAWAEAHGGERGFSMGRFHPDLIARQKVFLAWQDGALAGFATFHAVDAEWTLDLLRPLPGCVDGTSHGMIDLALHTARTAGVPRVSLAAAPLDHARPTDADDAPLAKLQQYMANRTGGAGLARFKSMFDPQWDPLYLAAPSRWALFRSGAEIARAVARPPPFPQEAAHKRHEPGSRRL